MIRRLVVVSAFLFFLSAPAFAWSVTVYTYQSVAGRDYARIGPRMKVKLCHVTYGTCHSGTSDLYGRVPLAVTREGYYYAYIWDPYDYEWGSIDTPDPNQYYVYPMYTEQVINLSAFPRPLQPGLVSPCNNCWVGLGNFYLVWTDGLDADRRASNWPVTYEIWTSTTLPGQPQAEDYMAVADAPCNPDSRGNCRWYVDYLASCQNCKYTWRIVVKQNFGGGIVYKTSGPKWYLYQMY